MHKVPAGYKQTEVGVIPEDWEAVLLDTVAKRGTGHTPNKKHPEYWDGQIKWISLQDSDRLDRLYICDTTAKITPEGIANSSAIMHSAGTVVLSRDAGVGKSAIMKDDMAVSQHFMAWKCSPSLNNYFLYYYLQVSKSEFERIAMGNTIKTIGLPYFKQLVVPLPTKAEQEAIAEALSDTDALIESLEQLIAKKRHLKQGAMQELLTGKKRLPGFASVGAGFEPVPTDVPHGWEMKRLGDVLKVHHGKSQHNVEVIGGKYPILASGGEIGRSNNYLYDKPSVLIGRKGTIDVPQFIDTPFWTIDTLFFTEIAPEADAKFIYYKFKTITWRSYNEASGVPSLSASRIENIDFSCPPLPEQTAIATILSDMDAEIAALESKLAKTRQLKQGMMHNLLTGKIRLVAATANITVVPEQRDSVRTATSSHNWQINEAVIIAVLAKHFGSEQYPLARKRCTKLTYLLHRHIERKAEGYLKKAAGPYNPATRYKGPEGIAQKNGYVRAHHNGTYQGFVAAANIAQAEDYFQQWYGQEALAWLEQFRLKKTDDLELLTTVDMAMEDLQREGKAIQVGTVKQVIHDHPEWIAKLRRELFSDINIARAMQTCRKLFA